MASIIALLLTLPLAASQPDDVAAALADQAKLPPGAIPYTYYLTCATGADDQRPDLATAICLMVATTSRQPIIERCTPQPVGHWVYRIDLRDLGWDYEDWFELLHDYPYQHWHETPPLLVRADWLLVQLADQQESDAYLRLLFSGAGTPKTRDEFFQKLGVGTAAGTDTPDYANFGMVEGQSGVAKNRIRWIENRPATRGYAWITRDILSVEMDKDPLENLTGGFKHDGEEFLVGLPKFSVRSGERGTLQVSGLANGNGDLVPRAPVDLVEDATRFRGLREIRNPGSCLQCHSKGINDPTSNELRAFIESGAQVRALEKLPEQIEAFHLSELQTEIERNQQDHATGVKLATGVEPTEAAAAFKRAVDAYDKPLNLFTMARELRRSEDALQDALAWASANGIPLSARLAGAATGITVPREAWESSGYQESRQLIRNWEQ